MDIFSKLNQFANTASGKATGAIELGKLNLKINAEEKKITDTTAKIGECLLHGLDEGKSYEDPVMSLYEDIVASRAAILSLRAQIAALNGNVLCASCQTENSEESKFCKECGVKLEEQPPIVAEVVVPENACPTCGATVEEDAHFCTSCGAKIERDEGIEIEITIEKKDD